MHLARVGAVESANLVLKDAERTRANILDVATKEFATQGYAGGRINEIARRTRTSKHMIYHYFGSKEGLYRAVLAGHYSRLGADEDALNLSSRPPLEALKQLIHFLFDWYLSHADEVPLIMVENLSKAAHLKKMKPPTTKTMLVSSVQEIHRRGVADGSMRGDLDPIDIHVCMGAPSFLSVCNRYTFKALFGVDLMARKDLMRRRDMLVDMVLRYVATDPRAAVAVIQAPLQRAARPKLKADGAPAAGP